MVRKSRGRQKIQLTRMSKESNLLVTFSKRRSGLFKKASELCILCAAEIAIIVFSPGKKVFSFGHPSVEAIVHRYLELAQPPPPPGRTTALQLVEAHRSASIRELNLQLNGILGVVEEEKVRGEEMNQVRLEGRRQRRWWEAPVKEMSLGELEQLREAMEDLRNKVFREVEKMMMMMNMPPPHFVGDGGGESGVVLESKGEEVGGACAGQLSATMQGFTLGFGPSFSEC